jgi:hypothetical protein
MTLDDDDRAMLAGLGFDPDYVEVVEDNSAACGPDDDGPGLDWDDGPKAPPSRRVVSIETTGDRL